MPKKHRKVLYSKPSSSAHPSLAPSSGSPSQHGRTSSAATRSPSSVNDLISHLRQTQIGDEQPQRATGVSNIPTVHPSLRNILDVPETLPPRPRAGIGSSGPTRTRRIPGPPPPSSWLTASSHAPRAEREKDLMAFKAASSRVQKQSCNLPGAVFPPERSLQHATLKAMAKNWQWHLLYYNSDLDLLPTRLKELLLSYAAVYSDEGCSKSLHLLFPRASGGETLQNAEDAIDDMDEVKRLDLTNALGTALSMKQILRELVTSRSSAKPEFMHHKDRQRNLSLKPLPDSWDDPDSNSEEGGGMAAPSIPASMNSQTSLRFQNLSHLSLGVSPTSSSLLTAASWPALLTLAEQLSTLSSLCLANWPPPTLTPHAAATYTTIRNPLSRTLPSISYGGSDIYTSHDGNWAEAAGILKRLSRSLYCLKWLDLTGCGAWFEALLWKGLNSGVAIDLGAHSAASVNDMFGAEWNGSWRGIQHIGLGVGWAPVQRDTEKSQYAGFPPARSSTSPPSLSASEANAATGAADGDSDGNVRQDWDLAFEREKYYHRKEVENYTKIWNTAQQVAAYLREVRRKKGGKWIEFDFGSDAPFT